MVIARQLGERRMNLSYSILLILVTLFVFGGFANGESSPDSQLLYERINSEDFYNKVKASQAQTSYKTIKKISSHEHYRQGGPIDLYFKVAQEMGIEKAVFVPTGMGPDNRGYLTHMQELLEVQKKYPNKVIAFATIDEADPHAAEILEKAIGSGARGLKLIGGHPNFYDEPLDSPNMYKVYQVVRKHRLPVLIHASLGKHPKQRQELERILKDFPDLTIVAAHYAKTAPKLEKAQELLDRYPNLFTDISMGGGLSRYQKEICLEPKKFRDFIIRNRDRILWGTDIILTSGKKEEFLRRRISIDFNIFEMDFYIDDQLALNQVLMGLNLPREILEKIYYINPKRILKL
jgi:predicted TIM-barrel fold metal-dependent hydrolase